MICDLAFLYLLAEKVSCSAISSKKEFAIVSNLRYISRTNFMLSSAEHEKSFIISGPESVHFVDVRRRLFTWPGPCDPMHTEHNQQAKGYK